MKEVTIRSYEEYCEYTEKFKNGAYFRGQADSRWPIVPSLFRTANASIQDEQQQVNTEMNQSGLEALPALLKLQHFGTPTRICDLTISIYAALFFAVSDQNLFDADGSVYIFSKTDEIELTRYEFSLFSDVLAGGDIRGLDQKKVEVLNKNYIIKYDYRFSYTNPRAMLQGGTGLLFGFYYENGALSKRTNLGVGHYITEKIIIPADIKRKILARLIELGYSENILYNSLDNIGNGKGVEFFVEEEKIEDRIDFKKVIIKFRYSNLYYDRDEFMLNIAVIYRKLLILYGRNAKVWLTFYYDDIDLTHGNWACRTVWDEETIYRIVWNKGYLHRRMIYLNEQVSRSEVITRFRELLTRIFPIYNEIKQSITDSLTCLPKVMEQITRFQKEIDAIEHLAQDVPFGDTNCEKISTIALQFINNVWSLAYDMVFFDNRGDTTESSKSTYYMLTTHYISKCEEKIRNLLETNEFRDIFNI